MKRRAFLQTSLAALAVPAMPLPAASAAPAAVSVNAAQFWATYFAKLPGHSPVRGVQIAMNVSAAQAQRVVSGFVAQGVLSPSALLPQAKRPDMAQRIEKYALFRRDVPAPLRDLRADILCDYCDLGAEDAEFPLAQRPC